MENMIQALKEFFFDIIGFLVPGAVMILLCINMLNLNIDVNSNIYIFILLAYVMGYLVFSVSLYKDDLFDRSPVWMKITSSKKIINDLKKMDTYNIASEMIKIRTTEGNLNLSNYKSFRNIAISALPDSNKIIYTFMFRAELFNQLHTITLFTLFCYFSIIIYSLISNQILMINYVLVFILIISVLTLRKGWERFYRISMNIPFSIYIDKFKIQLHEQ